MSCLALAQPSCAHLPQSIELFIYLYKLAMHYGFYEEHFFKKNK